MRPNGQRGHITSAFVKEGLDRGKELFNWDERNGFGPAGLPLSMQIVGRAFDESTVLRIGAAFEAATGLSARRPALCASGEKSPVSCNAPCMAES